jgi:excisionase family DNA binding protein
MTSMPTESLWTWKQVADFLQVSRSWVYQKAEANVLPSLRICGTLRFDPAAVRAFALGKPSDVIPIDRARKGAL